MRLNVKILSVSSGRLSVRLPRGIDDTRHVRERGGFLAPAAPNAWAVAQ
jgi:hypothetical protein